MHLHAMRSVGLVAAAVAAAAVSACPVPPAPHPEPEATCDDVCARWTALGCEEASPTPGGIECVESCEELSRSGLFEWDLECRATVSACEDIDACEE